MAFWGACVDSNEPYELDANHKRLRVSHATLEQRENSFSTKVRSILRCAVGSRRPVSVCSLSKDSPFCQLDLEFEESEQVIFTVKGPQPIHLSGYYVQRAVSESTGGTSSNVLAIDCFGEKAIVVLKKEERELAAGEGDIGGINSFTDGGRDNTIDKDYDLRDGFNMDNNLLVNADMHENADEKRLKKEQELLYAMDSVPQDDENYVLCIRKCATSGLKMIKKEGKDADKVTLRLDNMLRAIGSTSKETVTGVSRLSKKERVASLTNYLPLPSNEVAREKGAESENKSIELFSKVDACRCNTPSCGITDMNNIFNTQLAKIGEAHKQALDFGEQENERTGGEEKIAETDISYYENALVQDMEHQVKAETDHLCQDFASNTLGKILSISSTNIDIGDSPPMPSMFVLPSCDLDLQNSVMQEKERIEGCGNEMKSVERDTAYHMNATKENELQQAQNEGDDVHQCCSGNQLCQKSSTNIEIGGSHHLQSMIGLPSCELDWQSSGEKENEIKEGCEGVKTIAANVGHCEKALKENKVEQAETETDDMYEDFTNPHGPISTKNIEIGDSHPLLSPAEVHDAVDHKPKERLADGNVEVQPKTTEDGKPRNDRCENSQKSNKRKKKQVLDQNYVTGGGGNTDHASKKHISNNDVTDMVNKINILPANVEHTPADDNYPDLVEDGCRSDKDYKQRKMQKTKAQENANNFCTISFKARTLPNGLIIENLVRGDPGGKVAVPGRKVKVFYTARLRETGTLVESNVGQKKPFKFHLGDKKIIEGWNVGINGMHTGEKRRLIIPPSIGYGKKVMNDIPPNSWMVYDIELVSVR